MGVSGWVGALGRAAGVLADLSRPFVICAPLDPGFKSQPGPQIHVALGKWLPLSGLLLFICKTEIMTPVPERGVGEGQGFTDNGWILPPCRRAL